MPASAFFAAELDRPSRFDTDAGAQCVSFAFTERLVEAGVNPSVGSVGAADDNALAESHRARQARAGPAGRALARS
jgi:hypothetical protein